MGGNTSTASQQVGGLTTRLPPELNQSILSYLPHRDLLQATSTGKHAKQYYRGSVQSSRLHNPVIQFLMANRENMQDDDYNWKEFGDFLLNLVKPLGPRQYDLVTVRDMITDAIKFSIDEKYSAYGIDKLIYALDEVGYSLRRNDPMAWPRKKRTDPGIYNYIRGHYKPQPGDVSMYGGPLESRFGFKDIRKDGNVESYGYSDNDDMSDDGSESDE